MVLFKGASGGPRQCSNLDQVSLNQPHTHACQQLCPIGCTCTHLYPQMRCVHMWAGRSGGLQTRPAVRVSAWRSLQRSPDIGPSDGHTVLRSWPNHRQ
jgi:hypothetical protein